MSHYELVDLWITHITFAMTVFVAFLSATSAFLIVAHFKGGELRQSLYWIVTALYSVAAVFFLLLYAKTLEAAIDIREQARLADMDWYNIVYEPGMMAPFIFTTGFVVQVLLAFGSVWYFRSTRSR
jgi:hypothetical protein